MKWLSVVFVLCICACSDRGYYESIHTSHRNYCQQLAGSQRDECFRNLGPDYQTYERQRQELLMDDKQDEAKEEKDGQAQE
jgi:hypothetical protein